MRTIHSHFRVTLVAASLVFIMGYGNTKINLSPPGTASGDQSNK